MKSLTFAEFLLLPEGTIFGQDYALPHRDWGIFRKGATVESGDPNDEDHEEFDTFVMILDLGYITDGRLYLGEQWIDASMLEDDHRFLVYEALDIDMLIEILWGNP